MSRYVEFTLPDGSTIVIESDEGESGVVKAGRLGDILESAQKTFEQAVEDAPRPRWSLWKRCTAYRFTRRGGDYVWVEGVWRIEDSGGRKSGR